MKQIHVDHAFERYSVSPIDNPCKYIIIQNNRPLIRDKYKLKLKPLTWTLKEGEVKDNKNFERLIKAIENVLEPPSPVNRNSSWQPFSATNRKQKLKGGTILGERMK